MKNKFIVFLVLYSFFLGGKLFAEDIIMVENGQTRWRIVLPEKVTEVEKTAARELADHLKEATGAVLPVITENTLKDGEEKVILIGSTERTKRFLSGEKGLLPFKFDGIYLHAQENELILTGHERRGVLYAVYTFLEDYVGCRWWTPEERFIPQRTRLTIPANLTISYAPQMISREMYHRVAQPGVFSARLKGNGAISPDYGGRIDIIQFVHSFYKWIPPDKYFKDHPDWFSEIKGKRTYENAQLCLTNDDMRRELTKNILETLRKTPNAMIVDISQNDWYGYCTCPKCKALDEKEGSHSGTLVHFLNAVATDIEKEFPNVMVESLAYQYTRKPPKEVKPRKNILIRLCSIECSFVRPLSDPQNKEFDSDISGWSAIASQLFIWDYVTNYHNYIGPHPNYRFLADNVRYFMKYGAIGLFIEGEGDDFVEVRNWILLHLMWNPTLDEKKLFIEFCNGYYGKEITPILQEYLDVISERALSLDIQIGCFAPPVNRWLDLKTLNQITEIMNRAEEKSRSIYGADSQQVKRLLKTRLAVDYTWLKYYRYYKNKAWNTKLPFLGPKDVVASCKQFIQRCAEYKITSLDISSHGADEFNKILIGFQAMNQKQDKLPDFCNGVADDDLFVFDDALFANVNNAAKRVKDSAAWDGMTTAMPTEVDWNTNYRPVLSGKFHVRVSLRCDAESEVGSAMTFGVYDWAAKKDLYSKTIPIGAIKGKEYRWIDFGIVTFTEDAGFWFAHRHDPKVSNVYVDQVIMIHEK